MERETEIEKNKKEKKKLFFSISNINNENTS